VTSSQRGKERHCKTGKRNWLKKTGKRGRLAPKSHAYQGIKSNSNYYLVQENVIVNGEIGKMKERETKTKS